MVPEHGFVLLLHRVVVADGLADLYLADLRWLPDVHAGADVGVVDELALAFGGHLYDSVGERL